MVRPTNSLRAPVEMVANPNGADRLGVVLVFAGLAGSGGITVDVRNLERGLMHRGRPAVAVGSVQALRARLNERPSIVHVFGCLPNATTFRSMALAKVRHLPLVWTPVFHPSRPSSWKGYGLIRAMQLFDLMAPRAAKLADAVIGATPDEVRFFRRMGAKRSQWIPPGVSLPSDSIAAAEVDAFRRRVGLGAGPVVLVIGRDNSRKALPFGISAFHALRRSHPEAQLLLIGPDPRFPLAAAEGIRCPGWLDSTDVDLAFRASDVLFVPSLYEGLPRVVIEAWACSLPVVTTDRVALEPLVRQTGMALVPYGDAEYAAHILGLALDDRRSAQACAAVGRRLVEEHFLLDDVVERTDLLYSSLLTGA